MKWRREGEGGGEGGGREGGRRMGREGEGGMRRGSWRGGIVEGVRRGGGGVIEEGVGGGGGMVRGVIRGRGEEGGDDVEGEFVNGLVGVFLEGFDFLGEVTVEEGLAVGGAEW